MSKKPFAWSYSALTKFEMCPKQFWHLRIKRDYKESMDSPVLEYGKYVHAALEKHIVNGTPLPMDLAYLKEHVSKWAGFPGERLGEQKMAITAEFKPTGWFSDDVWCRAIIDLLMVGDKVATLIDHKTGKEVTDDTQLKLMALMLFLHRTELETVHAGFFYTKTKTVSHIVVRKEDTASLWPDILQRAKRLQYAIDHDEFPASPGGICKRHCPITSCPHCGG